jgi:hypothetical protein
MAYSTDADIVKIRPNILQLGVSDWSDMHDEAESAINRTIIRRWYKDAAANYSLDWRDTEFDSSLVDSTQFLNLSCYKTLEYCYRYLMKDSEKPDGFERQMSLFRDMYNQELEEVLATGISYDWDGSGAATDSEKFQRQPRRLTRV